MATPTFYINNAARRAADGLGDGTVYATASSAVPDPANMRFTLTGLAIIADLGADADDKFNGYTLYFPASGNRYHVVDWEAATDMATTYEAPQSYDTGACEFRRTLWAPDMDAAHPIIRAVNGSPSKTAKSRAANVKLQVQVSLPNLIGQAGFEELTVGAFPSTEQLPGKWWSDTDWAVSGTSPVHGSRMAVLTVPGSGDKVLQELLVDTLQAGITYRLIFKARSVTGATSTGGLQIYIENHLNGQAVASNVTPWSVPAIGTTATWYAVDFVPDFTTTHARIRIFGIFANRGAATAIHVDEVCIWDPVNVGALLAFNHALDGCPSPPSNSILMGYRCPIDRTNVSSDDWALLGADAAILGTAPYLKEDFAASIYPIYRITFDAVANKTHEIGELLLAETLSLSRTPNTGIDPQAREYTDELATAKSGAEVRVLFSDRRRVKLAFRVPAAANLATLDGVVRERHLKNGEPLAVVWTGHWDTPVLFYLRGLSLPWNTSIRSDAELELIESV